jgi:sphingomyelin phosphodiesterase acid-like 3
LTSNRGFCGLHLASWLCLLILAGSLLAVRAEAQSSSSKQGGPAESAASRTIPALFVSDIHFDPFHDPAKVSQLVHAPVSQWTAILSSPPSPNQQQAFTALQQTCGARGVDTPYALLASSLRAMRAQRPDAKFITVSGDLIAHAFTCRYTTLFPASTAASYEQFVVKTVAFVDNQLRASFPGAPVYVALGNNDTGCGDYQLDGGSDFLARSGAIVAEGLPASDDRQQAIHDFARGGYYSVVMGAPMRDTRLIVVNDLFLSPKYSTCAGKADPAAAEAQIAWLREQLAQSRRLGQKVWVMAHIPPGIDPYSTVRKFKDVCGSEGPEMFLSSGKLADLVIEYADVVRLGIFAHTHMDEVRLLEPDAADPHGTLDHSVVLKLVPSISPVDDNNPSFTVASVDPSTSLLRDYEVIAASNQTGIETVWSKEYDYAQSYHETQFSPPAVQQLIANFREDRAAKSPASEDYIRNYYVGATVPEIKLFWPQYVCALANHTARGYAACVCSSSK